jgi:MFS family permease
MTVHLIPYLVDQRHLPVESAAGIFAALTGTSWVGQLTGGQLGDRFEKRLICAGCMLLHTLGMVTLLLADAAPLLLLGALFHGLAWGMRGPLMMAVRADYFGRRSFATIEGLASVVTTVGLFLGPLIVGIIADTAGDYRPGLAVVASLTALGSASFFFARRPTPVAVL